MVGIVVVSHSYRIAEGRRRARPRDGGPRRRAGDRRRSGYGGSPDRDRRGDGDGRHRAGLVRGRRPRADGPRQRRPVGGDGARSPARGSTREDPPLRGPARRGRGRSRGHGEARSHVGGRRRRGARGARGQDRASGRPHRGRHIVRGGRRSGHSLRATDGPQPPRAPCAARGTVRADGRRLRRAGSTARPHERSRARRRLEPERGRHPRRHRGPRDRGRRLRASGVGGVGCAAGAGRARLR